MSDSKTPNRPRTGIVDVVGQHRELPWSTEKSVQSFDKRCIAAIQSAQQRFPASYTTTNTSLQPTKSQGLTTYLFRFEGQIWKAFIADSTGITLGHKCASCNHAARAGTCSFKCCKRCCVTSFQWCSYAEHRKAKPKIDLLVDAVRSLTVGNFRVSLQYFGGSHPGEFRLIEPVNLEQTADHQSQGTWYLKAIDVNDSKTGIKTYRVDRCGEFVVNKETPCSLMETISLNNAAVTIVDGKSKIIPKPNIVIPIPQNPINGNRETKSQLPPHLQLPKTTSTSSIVAINLEDGSLKEIH